MSENEESYGCIDGMCSVLPKTNCVELCSFDVNASLRQSLPLRKGDVIEGNYKNRGYWYRCTIDVENDDGSFDILYEDGDAEKGVGAASLRRAQPLRKGDVIEGNFKNRGHWYRCKIEVENDDGSFDVLYDDGDAEKGVRTASLRHAQLLQKGVGPMFENEESFGCIDGVCSVLPKTNCVELCETGTEKKRSKFYMGSENELKKTGLKNSDVKNLTIKAAAKFDSGVRASAIFPDEMKIAVASGNKIKILDANTLKEIGTLEGHTKSVTTVAVFRDGSRIVSGSDDNTIRIWDAATMQLLGTLEGHTGEVVTVAVFRYGSKIVSGSKDGTIKIWDAATMQLLGTLEGHTSIVLTVAVFRDGSKIVSGCYDGTIKIWDAATMQLIGTFEGDVPRVSTVAVFPDGSKIVSGYDDDDDDDYTIKIWDAATMQLLGTLEGHTEDVNTVAVFRDGSKIVSGSYDKTIKIWGAATMQLLGTLEGHTKSVTTVAVFRDGSKIVSGSSDRTIKIWDAATMQLIQNLFDNTDNNSMFRYQSFDYEGEEIALSPDGASMVIVSGNNIEVVSIAPNALQLWKNYTDRPDALLRNVKNLETQQKEATILFRGEEKLKDNTFEIVPYNQKDIFYHVFPYRQPLFSTSLHKIDIQDIVAKRSNFLNATIECANLMGNIDVFDNEVIKAVVQFKWDNMIKKWFQMDFALTTTLAIFYLVHSCAFEYYAVNDSDDVYGLGVTLLVLCFGFSTYFAFRELNHIANAVIATNSLSKLNEYFSDAWNVLHFSTCALMITDLCMRVKQLADSRTIFDDDDYSTLISAITLPLLAMEVFYYMSALSSFGPLIRMIIKIVRGIGKFTVILLIMIIAFTGSLFILYQGKNFDGFSTIGDAMYNVHRFIYGETLSIDDMKQSKSLVTTTVLKSIFMFFVQIVLLNLLIAIMGDIFDEVQARSSAEACYGRAKLIVQYESLFTESYKNAHPEFYPRYLFVLKRDEADGSGDTAWAGRIKEIKQAIRKDLKGDLQKLDDVKSEMAVMKDMLSTIQKLLDK